MKRLNKKRIMKPTIKFNNGKPVAICGHCRIIIEYIKYDENENPITLDNLIPRDYCDKCLEILKDPCYHCDKQESIDKGVVIIDTCETLEHLLAAENYIDNFKKMFEDITAYDELIEYLNDKRTSIKL